MLALFLMALVKQGERIANSTARICELEAQLRDAVKPVTLTLAPNTPITFSAEMTKALAMLIARQLMTPGRN